ncbi:glycosyltransferase [Methanothrix sp.]|jgi:trehalose synthase|uniref:glycosyltransferase n=1 Tax=Methanothrix sp. TaxID=90426 RepID=UPI00329A3146
MSNLDDYASIVGRDVIDELHLLAERLKGRSITNINSTSVGGGVAEILTRMIPLLRDLGVDVGWDVIKGNKRFFRISKDLHNTMHGVNLDIAEKEWDYFLEVNRQNAEEMDLTSDIIMIHDPQPIALVEKKKDKGNKWIWRCHIDITEPQMNAMDRLRPYIEKYDSSVFSSPRFARSDINIKKVLIPPSIDPLSDKNKELPESTISSVVEDFNIDMARPIVTQISRFDKLKDPAGVMEVYKRVKKHVDCQLVLAGGGATDDPEGLQVLKMVKSAAEKDPDIHVIFLPPSSDVEINALQRASTVILQKSVREGFGLTVTEALWKAKPVIASAVGGIPLQITHKSSGILTYSLEGTSYYLKELLNDPEYAKTLGLNGREHVRNNFLITRHIGDYLLLFLSLYHEEDVVRL